MLIFGKTISELSNIIIVAASVVGAIFVFIDKIIIPTTKFGKRRAETRKLKREKEIQDAMQSSIERNNQILNSNLQILSEEVAALSTQLREMTIDQNNSLRSLDKKIDENEIGRLRWEVLEFSNSLRAGQQRSVEDYDHIFEEYDKYKGIITRLGRSNGKIDREYAFINECYVKFQAQAIKLD